MDLIPVPFQVVWQTIEANFRFSVSIMKFSWKGSEI
jgi:hypothetical protein